MLLSGLRVVAILSLTLLMAPGSIQAGWQAGVAKVKITPTEKIWMGGYAARTSPAEGVLQDLYAKSLVLSDEHGNKVVLVTTDLIGIPRVLRENVVAVIEKKHQLKPEQILLNASHTHCGPELRSEKSSLLELDPAYLAQLQEYTQELEAKLVQVISESLSDLEPVELSYSFGRAGFAMNRRYPLADGTVRNSPYPPGPVQHQVPVLSVTTAEGKLMGLMFGYACHNTTTGMMQFNGDYAGAAQAAIEEAHPGTIALFMMGCGGDQNPYPRGEEKFIKQHGTALALAVEAALQDINPTRLTGQIQTHLSEIPIYFKSIPTEPELREELESDNKYQRRHAQTLLDRLTTEGAISDEYPYLIQSLQIGKELTLVALAGEVVVDYDAEVRREFPNRNLWIAGYSNDVFGYVPSLRVLREGGYEGGGAMLYTQFPGPFDESIQDRIMKEVVQQVSDLERSTPSP
ncbi:MAG: neutral/alkaline non-lysosomal ceramidase N-terminal domain-containing protein [Planctomycetaceae bacterium]